MEWWFIGRGCIWEEKEREKGCHVMLQVALFVREPVLQNLWDSYLFASDHRYMMQLCSITDLWLVRWYFGCMCQWIGLLSAALQTYG